MHHDNSHWEAPRGAWTILPMRVQQSRRIRSSSKSVLAALAYFARRSSTCWPTHKTLAAAAGVSPATVKRALDQLHVAGLVTWDRRSGRRASLYKLTLPRTHRKRGNSSLPKPQIAHPERQKTTATPRRRTPRVQSSSGQRAAADQIAAALTKYSSSPVNAQAAIVTRLVQAGQTAAVVAYIARRANELARRGASSADGSYSWPTSGLLAHVVAADYSSMHADQRSEYDKLNGIGGPRVSL